MLSFLEKVSVEFGNTILYLKVFDFKKYDCYRQDGRLIFKRPIYICFVRQKRPNFRLHATLSDRSICQTYKNVRIQKYHTKHVSCVKKIQKIEQFLKQYKKIKISIVQKFWNMYVMLQDVAYRNTDKYIIQKNTSIQI